MPRPGRQPSESGPAGRWWRWHPARPATKRWPPEHWRGLIRQLVGEGFDIAIVGGEDDALVADKLVEISPQLVAGGAGKFGLQETERS